MFGTWWNWSRMVSELNMRHEQIVQFKEVQHVGTTWLASYAFPKGILFIWNLDSRTNGSKSYQSREKSFANSAQPNLEFQLAKFPNSSSSFRIWAAKLQQWWQFRQTLVNPALLETPRLAATRKIANKSISPAHLAKIGREKNKGLYSMTSP